MFINCISRMVTVFFLLKEYLRNYVRKLNKPRRSQEIVNHLLENNLKSEFMGNFGLRINFVC